MKKKSALTNKELAFVSSLFKDHRKYIFYYFLEKTNNREDSEDLTSLVYMKVFRAFLNSNYEERGNPKAWLGKIAHNEMVNFFRSGNKTKTTRASKEDLQDAVDVSPNIEESLIKEEVYSRLKVMVDSLPEKEREVVYLRIYKQLSFKEIERLTKENSNSTRVRYGRAVIRLRQMMQEENKKKEPGEDPDAET